MYLLVPATVVSTHAICIVWNHGAETCIMPVLLDGCENWVVTEGLLSKLEKCLDGTVRRPLRWPNHLSTTAAVTVSDGPSVQLSLLVRKLGFLDRVSDDAVAMRPTVDDVEELCW